MTGWIRRIGRYARPQWQAISLVVSLMLAGVAFEALKPWPMKLLVDYELKRQPLPSGAGWITKLPGAGSSFGLVAWTSAATLALFILAMGALVIQQYVLTSASARMSYDLSEDVFDHLQHLSLRFHRSHQVGDLTRRTTSDCDCVKTLIGAVALPVVTAIASLAVMFWVMYRLDAQLALVAVTVALPLAALMKAFSRPMSERALEQYQLEGELMALAEQALTALPVVQAYTQEPHEDDRFRSLSRRTVRAFVGATVSQLQFSVSTTTVTAIGTAGVMVIGGNHVLSGRTTVGSLLVFLSYLTSLYAPLETLTQVAAQFASARAAAARVIEVLDEDPDVVSPVDAVRLGRARGHVAIEHVTYGYEAGRPVLRDVTIEAQPGETVAIVGRTGAGKSTVVSLVARLSDPWEGRVTIDGVDVRDLDLGSLRANVAHVLQEPYLFSGTIGENIAYGRPGAPLDEVMAAAMAADAHDFIRAMPTGYDTVVGERGVTLSGGQRQRIAIARALLEDAPILVLDEPTAALDAETEAAVVRSLRTHTSGRTTFVIAHRLSTVESADRLVVIDQGSVVESGTPEEVRASGGIYAQMYAVQHGIDRSAAQLVRARAVGSGRSGCDPSIRTRPTVAFVGRIVPGGGLAELVDVACAVATLGGLPDLRLLLVGSDTGYGAELLDLAVSAGCPRLLELAGVVHNDDLPALLSTAHVLALPAVGRTSAGLTSLEAMACALPVVGFEGGTGTQFVVSEENGMLVAPGDWSQFAVALQSLLTDEDARSTLGRQARSSVMTVADHDAALDRLEKVYTAIAPAEPLSR
jgi:ATP-binding cassette subfamily B protein/subfamily B ATP-binding cassette protein MsbA